MRHVIAAAALAAVLASPALGEARSKKERNPTWPQHSGQSAPPAHRAHSPNPAWDVYRSNGRYVGSDPDPSIRSKLLLDNPTYGD